MCGLFWVSAQHTHDHSATASATAAAAATVVPAAAAAACCRSTTRNIPEFKVAPDIALELLMAANFLDT